METRYLTLLFTDSSSMTSKIIKWRLGTDYSHVCGVAIDGFGNFDLYEASHGNVHDVDLGNFLKKNKVIKTCRIKINSSEQYRSIIRYLKAQRGKDYGEWTAIASTFSILRKLGIGKNGDAQFICSEYIARALEQTHDIDYSKYRKHTDYVDPLVFEKALIDIGYSLFKGLHLPEYLKVIDESL